jgi:uncharacterized protein YcbK (DUF882 family)
MSIWNWFKKKGPKEQPKDRERFEDYIDRQGFKNFTGYELSRYFYRWRGNVQNAYPPRALWESFLPTLRIIDELRDALDAPIRITSSYRSPAYNKAVGGAPLSFHKRFVAADIQVSGYTPHEVWKVLKEWRDKGKFKGGLGLYSTFVHIDTRGVNKDW